MMRGTRGRPRDMQVQKTGISLKLLITVEGRKRRDDFALKREADGAHVRMVTT